MKRNTLKMLVALLLTVSLAASMLVVLANYNRSVTDKTAAELGELYMAEMMLQMQGYFSSVMEIKCKEAEHIAEWTADEEYENLLRNAAIGMDFEYVALYDSEGNSECILGENAWFRNMEEYLERIEAGENTVTTGYLTISGEKYIVFGTPAKFTMDSGNTSSVMLCGISVDKLYEYINLDKVEQLGGQINLWIISSNGEYILKAKSIEEESFYERMNTWGSFVGVTTEEALAQIEKAMASGKSFSYMVSIDNEVKHVYGASAGEPDNWYFMITMPQGIYDQMLEVQNTTISKAYIKVGVVIFVMLCMMFFVYYRISSKQRKELKIAREEAEVSKNMAENANMAKTFFLSNMSHDIRTPMNAIIGFTNLAMEEKEISSIRKYLQKIGVSSNHLLLLINEILEMSRIESGKIVLEEKPCNLLNLLEELHTVLGKKAEERKQNFQIQGNVKEHFVYGDKRRLQQILINLADNAIKYTPEGGDITIVMNQLSSEKEGYGNYELVISDNGIGMSEEFVQKIFEPFERENTSTVSRIEGTGLGLPIVKNFIDMMGGTITVETKKDEGTIFVVKVCLRLLEKEKMNQLKEIHKYPNAIEEYDEQRAVEFFAGKHILLAEDNEFNREIAQSILEHVGFVVDIAENGEIVVQKVQEAEPDYYNVILMDVQMPIMNGYEATKAIRAMQGERSKVKIIAVTANAFETDRQLAEKVGMDGHIPKPINVEQLYATLKQLL